MNRFAAGDSVRIKEDALVNRIVLKDECITVWNDDSVEIDLRGQVGRVISTTSYKRTIWVCLKVTIAGCIKVRTFQREENLEHVRERQ